MAEQGGRTLEDPGGALAGPVVQQKERKKAIVGPLGLQGWPQIEGLVPAMNSKVGLEAPGTISGRSYWSQQFFKRTCR